jgi:hypothetical protein
MNQHEWVAGCQQYYRDNDLTPGNPDDGVWHGCHYPRPRCLGGTEEILLLEEHHAVQGVLQSEEYQVGCIHGWEKKHLSGDLLELYLKWRSAASTRSCQIRWGRTSPEERSEWGVFLNNSKSPESRWGAGNKRMKNKTLLVFEREEKKKGLGTGKGSPTPVTVHYPDGSVVKYESLPAAAEGTGVARSTIKSRLKYTLQQQRERLGTVSRT